MSEVVDKPTDAAIDAMNATLLRMHATKPTPHKPRPSVKDEKTLTVKKASRAPVKRDRAGVL